MYLNVLLKNYKQKLYERINKKRNNSITNKDLSLITNKCLGGFICHDYGMRFNSPFVNLWLSVNDFIKICSNLSYYLSLEVIENKELSETMKYPVGNLGDIVIYFQHYIDFGSAKKKWDERCKRINYSKLYFILTLRGNYDESLINKFLMIPYDNKICFVQKKISDSTVYITGGGKKNSKGYIWNFKSIFSLKKLYEQFNVYKWFCKEF